MGSRKGVKTLEEILEFLRTRREFLRKNFGVESLKVFGGEGATLFTLIELKEYLENALGLRVDVVSEGGLSPYLKPFMVVVSVF